MTTAGTDESRGLYGKYTVTKADGTPAPGPLFILNYGKDPHARVALAAYADSCAATHPTLSMDLCAALAKLRMAQSANEYESANPDFWRMRFANHIETGIRFAGLSGEGLDTAQGFDRQLTRAFTAYLNSTATDRKRQFLAQVNAIAAHAYAFYIELNWRDLDGLTDYMLFDLGGLAQLLARTDR